MRMPPNNDETSTRVKKDTRKRLNILKQVHSLSSTDQLINEALDLWEENKKVN